MALKMFRILLSFVLLYGFGHNLGKHLTQFIKFIDSSLCFVMYCSQWSGRNVSWFGLRMDESGDR